MKNLIARLFNLYTKEDLKEIKYKGYEEGRKGAKKFYQNVVREMAKNGSIVADVDLKIPKANLVIYHQETREVLARDGKWLRVPESNSVVVITRKEEFQENVNEENND